jgi:hypothetical protein
MCERASCVPERYLAQASGWTSCLVASSKPLYAARYLIRAHCTSGVSWPLRILGFCDGGKLSAYVNVWNSSKGRWDNDRIRIKAKQLLKSSKRMVSSITTIYGLRVWHGTTGPLHM